MVVLYNRIFLFSLFYIFLINKLFKEFDFLLLTLIFTINILIISSIIKDYVKKNKDFLSYIKKIKKIK